MEYEELLEEAIFENINVKELPLKANKGRITNDRIYIKKDLTTTEKKCVLSEELEHHHLTVGNILDQSVVSNRKQEHIARLRSYDRIIGLRGIIDAFDAHCNNLYEVASYLDVTEECLGECLGYYRMKYGVYTIVDNYIIYFEPSLAVIKML